MNLFDKQLKEGLFLSKMPQHKAKVTKALKDISFAISHTEKPYVALSWGKQSTVLMHLVFTLDTEIPGIFWKGPDSDIICNFNEIRDSFLNKWKIKYIEEYCEKDFKKTAKKWTRENHYDCVFMGLVEDESRNRKRTLNYADENNLFYYKDGTKRSCPLKKWNNMDIAAYVSMVGLPMLATYHIYGFDVRTSARIKFNEKSFTERGFDLLTSRQKNELLTNQAKRKVK